MPFWRNDLKIISSFRQIKTAHRLLISFVLISSPYLIFYIFFYCPSGSQVKQLNLDNKKLIQQKRELDEISNRLNDLECENYKMLKHLNLTYHKFDASAFITDLIQKHNLSCSDIKPTKSKQEAFIKKEYYSASVKGLFKDYVSFFKDLQSSGKFIKICQFKMYKHKGRKIKIDLDFRGVSLAN